MCFLACVLESNIELHWLQCRASSLHSWNARVSCFLHSIPIIQCKCILLLGWYDDLHMKIWWSSHDNITIIIWEHHDHHWGYHDHHTNQKLVNPPSVLSAFVWCGCSSSDAGGRDEIWIGIWMTMRMIMMMMILMMMMIRMVATTTTTMMTMNMLKWCWQDKRDMNLNPVPIEVPASLREKWEWNCKQLLFKCAVLSVKKETF